MKKIKYIISVFIIVTAIFYSYYGSNIYLTSVVPELKPGIENNYVQAMQQRLKNWGYYEDKVNGNYDHNTFLAVKEFQSNQNLPATGFAQKETLEAMGLTKFVEPRVAYARGDSTSDEQLLARAINGEARGEPYIGQVAVGAVILNRTRDSRFPNTIAGVIYQPLAFTAVADGQINVPIDPNSTVLQAARDALNGWDPTDGCLYYWNPETATSEWIWSREVVKKIGKHNFGN